MAYRSESVNSTARLPIVLSPEPSNPPDLFPLALVTQLVWRYRRNIHLSFCLPRPVAYMNLKLVFYNGNTSRIPVVMPTQGPNGARSSFTNNAAFSLSRQRQPNLSYLSLSRAVLGGVWGMGYSVRIPVGCATQTLQ